MASKYLPEENRGIKPLVRAADRIALGNIRERAATTAGPPALVRPPATPSQRGVAVDPPGSQLQREGALRPQSGPWSLSNAQPMTDGSGALIPAPPVRPQPLARAAVPQGAGATPATRAGSMVAAASPVLATVTPQNAANAVELTRPTPASFAGAGGGAATTSPTPAVSQSGRPLGYGRNIGGVQVFSDGSGGAGAPPATMSQQDIDGLATGSRLSRADPGIGGGIASEAAGGTLELGGARALALTRPSAAADPYARAQADNARARRGAASDAASIATEDTRSVLGRAARNARVTAESGFGTANSRRTGFNSAIEALNTTAAAGVPAQERLGGVALQEAGATERSAIAADAETTRAALTRPAPSPIDLADGTLGSVGQDGIVRPITDAKGQPARRQQTRDDAASKRATEIEDALAKAAGELLAASVPPGQQPTPEMIAGARLQAAQLRGLRTATGPNGQRLKEINGEWVPL